jgi:hypothetical protein
LRLDFRAAANHAIDHAPAGAAWQQIRIFAVAVRLGGHAHAHHEAWRDVVITRRSQVG